MLALPDDGVAARLQKLVDQCRHGNAYCRQVLGLHQLSKVTDRGRPQRHESRSLLQRLPSLQELQCSFSQICSQEPASVLEQLLLSEQPDRFQKAQTFIRAQGLGPDAVAELVSSALVQALTPSSQDLQPGESGGRAAPGSGVQVQVQGPVRLSGFFLLSKNSR